MSKVPGSQYISTSILTAKALPTCNFNAIDLKLSQIVGLLVVYNWLEFQMNTSKTLLFAGGSVFCHTWMDWRNDIPERQHGMSWCWGDYDAVCASGELAGMMMVSARLLDRVKDENVCIAAGLAGR